MSSGKIAQVVGPVVDVAFATGDKLPEINNALVVYTDEEKSRRIVLEVALELGEGVVRTIAMESTDGLTRGLEVLDTGRPKMCIRDSLDREQLLHQVEGSQWERLRKYPTKP